MYTLRQWLVVFIVWVFFIFNIERLSPPVNISSFSYIFLVVVTLGTLIVPFIKKLPLQVFILIVVPLFLLAKLANGRSIWGAALPLTVTETSAIILTALLARQLNRAWAEFQDAVATITISRVGKSVNPFSTEQGEMYREVRRARQHNRPLTMLALEMETDSIDVALHDMVKEVQQAMMEQFMLARVTGVLCDELHDYDIIAQQNGHFLVLLPEVKKEDLPAVVNPLCQAVFERTGVQLGVGAATFPDNAATFEGLVQEVTRQLAESSWSRPTPVKAHRATVPPSSS